MGDVRETIENMRKVYEAAAGPDATGGEYPEMIRLADQLQYDTRDYPGSVTIEEKLDDLRLHFARMCGVRKSTHSYDQEREWAIRAIKSVERSVNDAEETMKDKNWRRGLRPPPPSDPEGW